MALTWWRSLITFSVTASIIFGKVSLVEGTRIGGSSLGANGALGDFGSVIGDADSL